MTDNVIGPDQELTAAVDDFFSGIATKLNGENAVAALWESIHDLGFTLVGVPEQFGGSGGTLQDSLAVVRAGAFHALPLPLAETALAAWLLADAQMEVPSKALSVAPGHSGDTIRVVNGRATGAIHDVPFGRAAHRVLALITGDSGAELVLIDPSTCQVGEGTDLAGQPRDVLTLADVAVETVASNHRAADIFWRAALLRASQISGAISAVDRLTRRYTAERVQFGKPIAAFQAVQQHIVSIAQAVEITTLSVWRASAAASRRNASFESCAAKLVANESARVVVRASHQAHGAIGMTQEYPLHRFTRRLNTWRHEFGTERSLSEVLGASVARAPSFSHCISDHDNGVAVQCPI